ncbi:MAG: hypothetical protein ACREOF_06775 [Gemmatimonadales bacterium]
MALAILRFEEVAGDRALFDVDLGRNRWFVYAIGDGTTERVHGIELLADPSTTSELLGPIPPEARGRTTLEVPVAAFDREKRFMQVMSFSTAERRGPAVSEVVSFHPGGHRLGPARSAAASIRRAPGGRPGRGTVPFTLVEAKSRPLYSTAFFWQALLGLLPTVIPMVAPLLGNLFKGLFGGSKGGSQEGGQAAGGAPPVPDFLQQIIELVQKPEAKEVIATLIKGATTNGAEPKPAEPVATGSSLARAQFVDGGVLTGPALAGLLTSALPALMPLLQQFANPQMMNTLLTGLSPERTIGGLTDILMDPNRRQFERLWQHTPHVGGNVLPQLLLQLGGRPSRSPVPPYRLVNSVSLAFEDLSSETVNGTSRVPFRAGHDITLTLSLMAPKPISGAELHWQVKHPITLESLAHGVVRHGRAESGRLPELTIPAAALAALPVPEDYILGVALVWKNKRRDRIGARSSVVFTWAGEYLFDRAEDAGPDESEAADEGAVAPPLEPVALSDVQGHRDFWHKVWEGSFTDDARTRRIECKYYYALEDRPGVARMQTIERRVKGERDESVLRLKTGLLLSPGALNALLPAVSEFRVLDAERLAAIGSADFRRRVAQAALARITLRGRAGERAALWVYPEVKLQRVILKRAAVVAESGQITEFAEVPVVFPVPSLAHFIATRTER